MTERSQFKFKRMLGLTALFMLLGFFFVVIPYVYSLTENPLHDYESYLGRMIFAAMKGTTVFVICLMGGCIGSFVNVVAYRMPLGLSVVTSPSACPQCKSNIKGRDNLPVFGWIFLGGRCRSCKLPISARYPIVEFVFAMFFLILLLFELIQAGANLPGFKTTTRPGVSETIWFTNWSVMGIYLFHCTLICLLATLALFKYDRNRIPLGFVGFGILVGIVATTVAPFMLPVKWIEPLPEWLNGMLADVSTPLVGLVAGAVMGGAIEGVLRNVGLNGCCEKGMILAGALVGLFLGWQALITTCFLFAVLYFFSRLVNGPLTSRLPVVAAFTVATLLQICLWDYIAALF